MLPTSVRICIWCILGGLLGLCVSRPATAQFDPDPSASRPVEARTNLFATLDLAASADALRADLPGDWTLVDAVVLRYGSQNVPVRIQRSGPAAWIVPRRPLRGPHEIILQVETGTDRGVHSWSLAPAKQQGLRWDVDRAPRITQRITLHPSPQPDASNRVLPFGESRAPVQVTPGTLPVLGRDASFTAELWMRTTGLDEVVLSTWSGDEQDTYPLEVVVDPSGRLRSYCGQPGRHQALVSQTHVADGRWHHVAVVYAAAQQTLRLVVDGVAVDSLTNVSVPPAGSRPALAVGGRVEAMRQAEAPAYTRFSGAVDEVRVWRTARSVPAIRQAMRRPSAAGDRLALQLEFDDDRAADRVVDGWPEGAEPTASTLSLRTALQDLKATAEGSDVQLRWSTDARDIEAFVVERSSDGTAFVSQATLDPRTAARARRGDGPPTFTFTDENVPGQVVFYRIRQVYTDGATRTSGILKMGLGPPSVPDSAVQLLGNFPNPFTETTTIAYEVNERASITLSVWNLTGNRVADLVDDVQAPGRYEHRFDASDLPSGTYFVRLQTPDGMQSHRMVVLK